MTVSAAWAGAAAAVAMECGLQRFPGYGFRPWFGKNILMGFYFGEWDAEIAACNNFRCRGWHHSATPNLIIN